MKGMNINEKIRLATQIFVALVLGIVVGAVFYGNKTAISYITPIGDIFIHLIKMIVVPIVYFSINCCSSWCRRYEEAWETGW